MILVLLLAVDFFVPVTIVDKFVTFVLCRGRELLVFCLLDFFNDVTLSILRFLLCSLSKVVTFIVLVCEAVSEDVAVSFVLLHDLQIMKEHVSHSLILIGQQ